MTTNIHSEMDNSIPEAINVLLIEDDDALPLGKTLAEARGTVFNIERADGVQAGLERLVESSVDIILLDLGVPDSHGLDAIDKLHAELPEVPILVLTGVDDETLGVEALQRGGHDYLVKGRMGGDSMARCIRYAIERHRMLVELRKSTRALQESEEKLRRVIDSSPDAVMVTDLHGNITECNQTALDQHDCSASEELTSKSFFDLIAPRERQRAAATLEITLKVGTMRNLEYTCVTKDGREFPVELSASVIHDPSDRPAYFVVIAKNIAERKRAMQALKESEEKYRDLFENANDLIQSVAPDGHFLYVNRAWRETLGYSEEEIADLSLFDVIHPDSQAHCVQVFQRVTSGQKVDKVEATFVAKDGREIIVEGSANYKFVDGKPVATRGIFRDITERKQMEEQMRLFSQIVQQMGDAVILSDDQERIQYVNNAFSVIYGYTKDEVIGKPASMLSAKPDEEHGFSREDAAEAIQRDGEFRVEYRDQRKDGTKFWVSNTFGPVYPEGGKGPYWLGIVRDIDERKQMEAALKEERGLLARRVEERTADLSAANAELARAARLKDEFLASMSHELRTPLNAILGMSEALQEEVYGHLNDKQMRSLRSIEESGRHLLDLINDVLDVSKIEAGRLELQIEDVSLESICQASLQFIKQDAHKKRLRVSSKLDSAVRTFQADERRLKQILVNLLNNAVKFTPEGGEIGLEVIGDPEQEIIHFTVWDTGIGISQEQMARLFKPFVQLDSSLSRQYTGTGLGLALVQRLVELHCGSISVESQMGKGSRFMVSLPWQETAESVEGQGEAETTESDTADPSPIRRALIVEDSRSAAEQIGRYLTELGIQSIIHDRGEGTVDIALEVQPDVIILDILLPDPTGWDVLAQLKAEPRTRDIPVLIISVVDDRSQGLELGAAGYLVKPISRQRFRHALSRISSLGMGKLTALPEMADEELETEQASILLAEDNEGSINTISDYLRARGYRINVVRNGNEAIQRAKEEKPDLILMDIQMPGMDGLEATRRIRSDADLANIPIIALTALAMPGDRERCLEAGANDYISKPVSLNGLVKTIKAQLDRSQIGKKSLT